MRKVKRISMRSLEAVDNQQELYALETIAELIVKISLSNFKSKIANQEKANAIKKRYNEHRTATKTQTTENQQL